MSSIGQSQAIMNWERSADSRNRIQKRVVLAVTFMVILAACTATGTEATDTTPLDETLVSAGADLYQASCAQCHGADLRGTDQGPSHLSIVYEPNHHGDIAFLLAVQQGARSHHWSFGDMPAIQGLTPEDVEAIVAYIRDQQRIEGFEPYPPP